MSQLLQDIPFIIDFMTLIKEKATMLTEDDTEGRHYLLMVMVMMMVMMMMMMMVRKYTCKDKGWHS